MVLFPSPSALSQPHRPCGRVCIPAGSSWPLLEERPEHSCCQDSPVACNGNLLLRSNRWSGFCTIPLLPWAWKAAGQTVIQGRFCYSAREPVHSQPCCAWMCLQRCGQQALSLPLVSSGSSRLALALPFLSPTLGPHCSQSCHSRPLANMGLSLQAACFRSPNALCSLW